VTRDLAPAEQPGPPGDQATAADVEALLAEAMAGRGPAELQNLLSSLLAAGPLAGAVLDRPAPPSRRRPRRPQAVTYRVRIDLLGAQPPLWRRLELVSDLFLDEVHEIIQIAFGWTDSHLHGFGSGPEYFSPETERYLCPFDVEEGETGIPEGAVRLDEVLVDPGDKMFYTYDYGDDWQHVVALEAVAPHTSASHRAACTGGCRAGPAEDCGGVYSFDLIAKATDPGHPDRAAAAAELADMFGDGVDITPMAGAAFSIDDINGALLAWSTGGQTAESGPPGYHDLPGPLGDLVSAVRISSERQLLLSLIGTANLSQPVLVEAATAARMVRPYAWLLDRVGDDGIKLTGAGYLPPVHVAAATAELGLADEWIGKGNRENQTLPVLVLRETAQRLGLLRKYSGTLLLTPRGRAARGDPVALWWHLAERMPVGSTGTSENQAGLLLLVLLAAAAADDLDATIARMLTASGWMIDDGSPLTARAAAQSARDTEAVLRRIGVFAENRHSYYRSDEPTSDGVTFARAALRTWPGGSSSPSAAAADD
jgi:hypothetical protein